jgi:hypothetical protein
MIKGIPAVTVIVFGAAGIGVWPTSSVAQTTEYTRYELLAPGSGRFRILSEVTATPVATGEYFSPIRKGSASGDVHVVDRGSGKPLPFDLVPSAVARAAGVRNVDTTLQYIRVKLPRLTAPNRGQTRLLIEKTYGDAASYSMHGDTLLFTRPLVIKRNSVVLPQGYELVACNFPSQVLQEDDGRIAMSFWNTSPAEAPLTLRARPARGLAAAKSSVASRLGERARQNREIVYFLQQPETHAFDLYHDYTESRPGTSTYLNVVRAGSSVAKPSARNLDTGEDLKWEVLKGDAITRAKLDVPNVTPETEVVVFHFAPVKEGESIRLRMFETYTDTARYKLVGDELLWDRSFGRPANAVVLPAGWLLTNSSIPATVSETNDGRIRLDFVNPRPDEIAVLITARRRSSR